MIKNVDIEFVRNNDDIGVERGDKDTLSINTDLLKPYREDVIEYVKSQLEYEYDFPFKYGKDFIIKDLADFLKSLEGNENE